MPLEYLAIELQVQRYRYADCLFMFSSKFTTHEQYSLHFTIFVHAVGSIRFNIFIYYRNLECSCCNFSLSLHLLKYFKRD